MGAASQSKRFVRNFLSVSLGNYGAIALSFALNIVLTWRLGAEGFGRLALLIMAAQVLACFVSNWTLTGLVRFGAQEFARTSSMAESFWARTWVTAPWLGVAALALVIWQEQAAAYFEIPAWGVWVVFASFLFAGLLQTLGSVFQACQQMDRYAVTLFMDKALALPAILMLPLPYSQDPVVILGCYALSSLLVSVWAMASLGPGVFVPVRASRATIGSLWGFSLPLFVSTWVGLIGTQWVTYVIIKHYLAFAELGWYSLAVQVAGGVQQITIIMSSLLLPQFSVLVADRREAEIRKLVEQVMPYGLMVFALLLSGGVLLAGVGIPLIFGTGFSGAVRPFILLMVATMGLALFNSFMPLLSAHGSTWVLTGITIASASVNLAAAVGLIPFFGIAGAAVATVLGYGTAGALMLAAVQIRFGLRTLRLGLLCLPVLAVALCGLWLEGLPFYLVGLGSVAVTVVALVGAFGLFGKEDLVALGGVNLLVSLKVGLSKVFSVRMS